MAEQEQERCPVSDWATDFDHTNPEYTARAPEIWEELRTGCPVAHSARFGGTWLPTRHVDVAAIAHDTEHFSSVGAVVTVFEPEPTAPVGYTPPITSDPPFHEKARRLLLPAFSPRAIRPLEESAREFCSRARHGSGGGAWPRRCDRRRHRLRAAHPGPRDRSHARCA